MDIVSKLSNILALMKLNYRKRVFIYSALVLAAFTAFMVILERNRERRFKIEGLELTLNGYADIISNHIGKNFNDSIDLDINYIMTLLPENTRVTIIKTDGNVIFDNEFREPQNLGNHRDRPEIIKALEKDFGSNIRESSSTNHKYFYFAKFYNHYFVRVAQPYDLKLQSFLHSDNIFLYIIVLLFFFIILAFRQILYSFGNKTINLERDKLRQIKYEMTNSIAHELRTPVTSIRGFLETILENNPDEETRKSFTEKAYAQIVRLSELIQDIGIITKMEEAVERFPIETIQLKKLLDELVSEISHILLQHKINLVIEVSDSIELQGNRTLMYAIFRNLIDNSVRHGGAEIQIRIRNYTEDKNFYYFSFSDNGKGVEEKHLIRIFERFYCANEGRSRDTGGSGLGLSIVKNAVLFHKGEITAKNSPEGGLEFLFTLKKN